MAISVLIIAHNEEAHIAACIKSLLSQTKKVDEIVLVSHNSTDRTAQIARQYPVRVIEYDGPKGAAYARMRGCEEVTGDVVLCIDGDSVAEKHWVEIMRAMLETSGTVLVGSWIKMAGLWYAKLGAYRWYLLCNTRGSKAAEWIWGASFGFLGKDKDAVIDAFKEGLRITEHLALPYNPDDYLLALLMSKRGTLEVTNRTWVTAYAKETFMSEWFVRGFVAYFKVRKKILAHLKEAMPVA